MSGLDDILAGYESLRAGQEVPVDHACGHDMHMACMTGMATLMAARRDRWHGTLITLFQPAEETGEGAQDMVDDGLFKRIPVPDVALGQHLLPGIAWTVATCPGPFKTLASDLSAHLAHGADTGAAFWLSAKALP
jgi:metal-dependent amidase/aminoacylase/carboxypeptidase family protein